MIHIYIVSDSHKHFLTGISEYEKRLQRSIQIHTLKPSKKRSANEVITEESNCLLKKLENQSSQKILLHMSGKQQSSENFAKYIDQKQMIFWDISFIIGWAYGVNHEIEKLCDETISFSKMTFPHWLALMVLLEQVYRALQIKKGTGYHK